MASICDDVLIDVCRFFGRQQLANSICALNRRSWHWFQPGQVFHRHPIHWINYLNIQTRESNRTKFFSISSWLEVHKKRIELLSKPGDVADDDGGHPGWPPNFVRFKIVRILLDALLTIDEHNQSIISRLDDQKVALINRLFDNFRGATLTFLYFLVPSKSTPKNRRWFSMLLSDQFFAHLFAQFDVIQFDGDPLPIEAMAREQHLWEPPEKIVEKQALIIEQTPLLLLPGLLGSCQKLMFECRFGADPRDAIMLGVNEIVAWLHQPNKNERFLCIRGIKFVNWWHAVHWMRTLTTQLVKCLRNASHARPYLLYICGPMFDMTAEEEQAREGSPLFQPGVMAQNLCTNEEIVHSVFRGDWHTDPVGIPVNCVMNMPAAPLGAFHRRTIEVTSQDFRAA